MRHVLASGAALPYPVLERLRVCLPAGATVHSVYGATEALPISMIGHHELLPLRPVTTSGSGVCPERPLPGVTVRVLPLDPVPSGRLGTVGEPAVAGPNVSPAYLDGTVGRASEPHDREGGHLHRMGDAGRLDEQGRIWFHGRIAHRVRTAAGDVRGCCSTRRCPWTIATAPSPTACG
ncbi:AMP-binding protein [Streptomyces roseifaciens]|uniref:AMP-binding protein n=1 Tax=Streptomyces roseifaciens TaxID=1488406 RepID=UPI000718208E|nr:AMP-binding protein [Streptomyces roseifaciens]